MTSGHTIFYKPYQYLCYVQDQQTEGCAGVQQKKCDCSVQPTCHMHNDCVITVTCMELTNTFVGQDT